MHPGDLRPLHQVALDIANALAGRRAPTGASWKSTISEVAVIARLVEPLGDLDALGVGVVGAVGVEAVGDRAAERAGEEEEGQCEERDAAGAAVGEACEMVEHQRLLSVSGSPVRRPRARTIRRPTR